MDKFIHCSSYNECIPLDDLFTHCFISLDSFICFILLLTGGGSLPDQQQRRQRVHPPGQSSRRHRRRRRKAGQCRQVFCVRPNSSELSLFFISLPCTYPTFAHRRQALIFSFLEMLEHKILS